jgi:hypothetical protein
MVVLQPQPERMVGLWLAIVLGLVVWVLLVVQIVTPAV